MKYNLLMILLLISLNLYSQNSIKISRSLRNLKPTSITRTIHTNIPRSFVALDIAKYQSLNAHTNWNFRTISSSVDVTITRQLAVQTLKAPRTIYGPYNYVRTFSKISKNEEITSHKYLQDWKNIDKVNGYNGAHHIINKYTLKLIWQRQRDSGIKTNLSDMQNNAPAIFHPFHGHKDYAYIFHNPLDQIHDYYMYGMKVTIMHTLMQIDQVGIANDLPAMKEEYLLGILKEAELWCKTYQLVWEKDSNLANDIIKP